MDTREADGVEEGFDLEYHDASENSSVPEPPDLVPLTFPMGVAVVHHLGNALSC